MPDLLSWLLVTLPNLLPPTQCQPCELTNDTVGFQGSPLWCTRQPQLCRTSPTPITKHCCPWQISSLYCCHGRNCAAFPHFNTQNDSLFSTASHTHAHKRSNSVCDMFRSAPYKHKAVPKQAFANLTLRMPTVFKPFYKTAFISRGVHDIYMGSAWCLAHVLVPDWPALNNDALPLSTDGTITIVMKISNHGNMLTKYGI